MKLKIAHVAPALTKGGGEKCAAELAAKRAQTDEQRRVLEDKRSRLEIGRKQYLEAKKILKMRN